MSDTPTTPAPDERNQPQGDVVEGDKIIEAPDSGDSGADKSGSDDS